ncbi:MAG: hypothetical protein K8I00_09280 [Candidatus Omnitrophica bacterium]|nr:hypothetical protein [Candidatus Omnitrophota bacterium]
MKPRAHITTHTDKWNHTAAVFCHVVNSRLTKKTTASDLKALEETCRILSQRCARVVLVGNYDYLPESLIHHTHIVDNLMNKGPIGCLEALLSSGIDTEYLITPCDVGVKNPAIFGLLTEFHVKSPAILAYPRLDPCVPAQFPAMVNIVDQPLVGKYSVDTLTKVREQIIKNDLSMHRLAQLSEASKVVVPLEMIYGPQQAAVDAAARAYHRN